MIQQPLQQVFDRPAVFRQIPETEDVLLHGQLVRVTEVCPDESYDDREIYTVARFGRFFHYVTDYGYEGYIADGEERIQTETYLSEFQTPQDMGAMDAERLENLWGQYAGICE